MWELRGWSGWKLAVFPCLEILLFLSFPFLWVHPLGVYPPGRVVLFPLFLFQSCVCPLLPRVSASSFLLFPQTLGSRSPRPFGYPCTFRIFGGRFHSSYSSVGWGCGAQERERWCVERQDLMGKTPIYKSLRSARKESRTPTSKKADRVTPFVPGISALRELLDKTMSNHVC